MPPKFRTLLVGVALLAAPAPLAAQEALTVAEARASLVGRWEGLHESLDSDAVGEAFAWPIAVSIEDAGDGSTLIERVQFEGMDDDGALQITVSLLDGDGATEHGSLFTRGTLPEHRSTALSLAAERDETHWTLAGVAEIDRDGVQLQARTVAARDGDTLVIAFEVDPAGDEPPYGRTRRTLRRAAEAD